MVRTIFGRIPSVPKKHTRRLSRKCQEKGDFQASRVKVQFLSGVWKHRSAPAQRLRTPFDPRISSLDEQNRSYRGEEVGSREAVAAPLRGADWTVSRNRRISNGNDAPNHLASAAPLFAGSLCLLASSPGTCDRVPDGCAQSHAPYPEGARPKGVTPPKDRES